MSSINPIQSYIPTPKTVFAGVESVFKLGKRFGDAARDGISVVANTRLLAGLSQLPESADKVAQGIGFIALPLIPFEIVRFGNKVSKILTAEAWAACGRASLDAFADISVIVSKIVAPYKLLKALDVIGSVPMIPFLNLIALPCTLTRVGLDIWDMKLKGRTFSVIRSGASNLEDNDTAIAQLEELKKADLKEVASHLELSPKQCKVAEIVNNLQIRLQNRDEGALEETKEFYAKLKNRATLTYSLSLVDTTLNIASLAINIVLLPIPFAPTAALGFASASMGLGRFGIWAGKGLLMKDDIFNPDAKCGAYTAYETVKNAGSNIHNFCMQKMFAQAA